MNAEHAGGSAVKDRSPDAWPFDVSGSVLLISDTPALSQLLIDVLGPLGITLVEDTAGEATADSAAARHRLVLVDAARTGIDVDQVVRQLRSGAGFGSTLDVGPIQIAPGSRTVRVDGAPIELTSLEYAILERLAREPGQVVSRDALMRAACGRAASPLDRSLDVHMSNLRRKLGRRASQIVTVRGSGYVLRAAE